MYISHMRSEGNRLLEAIDELIDDRARGEDPRRDLSPQGGRRAELDEARRGHREDRRRPRAAGCDITADMYTYTAGATGLDAAMPPWVQEGGYEAWRKRLQDPAIRAARRAGDARRRRDDWENLLLAAGSPEACCWSASRTRR